MQLEFGLQIEPWVNQKIEESFHYSTFTVIPLQAGRFIHLTYLPFPPVDFIPGGSDSAIEIAFLILTGTTFVVRDIRL
jgi:hypothetical protein